MSTSQKEVLDEIVVNWCAVFQELTKDVRPIPDLNDNGK